ncbi:hypothetical protein RDI58_024406 [Solanum bulbocastanum]|uniref:Pre-mRNA-processing factor 19 n=1 Tax=Solanum bulbocastanum TaxID=147425 RepID=A0AAN8Y5L0_SOLBU
MERKIDHINGMTAVEALEDSFCRMMQSPYSSSFHTMEKIIKGEHSSWLKKERDEARELLAKAERQVPMAATTSGANGAALSYCRRAIAAEEEEMDPGSKKIHPGISEDGWKTPLSISMEVARIKSWRNKGLVHFAPIPREGNALADFLANLVFDFEVPGETFEAANNGINPKDLRL